MSTSDPERPGGKMKRGNDRFYLNDRWKDLPRKFKARLEGCIAPRMARQK
jgi:hypothetical protein